MSENLKQRTAKGFVWGLLNQGSMEVLNLVFGIVLARLLTPADYGIVGVLTVFSLIATTLQSCGFTQGLINLRDATHRDYNSVFWFNITVSSIVYVVLFLSAPLIADFFHEPCLLWVCRLVFLGFLISAMGTVPGAYLTKHLMVKQEAIINLVAVICAGTTGTVLAYLGYAYWALAWQQIVFISVNTIGRFVVVPFRPSLSVSLHPVREMFRFCVGIMLTSLIGILSKNILTFIFGRMLPMAQVGNYSQANKWSVTASETIRGAVGGIAQPVLKEVRDDRERTLRVLGKMVRITSFVTFPALFGLALVSEEFILVALGEKWRESALLLSLLAIGGCAIPLFSLLQNILISRGMSVRYLQISVMQVVLQLVVALALIGYGMTTVVSGFVVLNIVFIFVWHGSIARLTGYTLWRLLGDTMPFALTAIVTMLVTAYATNLCALAENQMWMLLAMRVIIATLLYICILRLMGSEELLEAWSYVKRGGKQ